MGFLVAITKMRYQAASRACVWKAILSAPIFGLHVFASLALPQQAVVVLGKVCTHSGSAWKLNEGHAQRRCEQSARRVLYIRGYRCSFRHRLFLGGRCRMPKPELGIHVLLRECGSTAHRLVAAL
jgi:hypothetical protein